MVYRAAKTTQLMTNWEIGRYIVEYEQNGQDRAKYGSKLLHQLSKDLTLKHKKGFSRSNVNYMRLLYKQFPIVQTLSVQLAWGHYCELLSLDDELERSFYVKQCEIEGWAVHELRRQIKSMLFHRLALSKDKEGVLALSREGHRVQNPSDLLREPFMLEFLGIPEKPRYKEKHLETRIITFLQDFLLEMGKGFAFIGRQYRIQIDGDFYRIDLLFYHRILKCFVIIDLKTGTAGHRDVGQMNMYLTTSKPKKINPTTMNPSGLSSPPINQNWPLSTRWEGFLPRFLSPAINFICPTGNCWKKNFKIC